MAFSNAFSSGFSVGQALRDKKKKDEEEQKIRQILQANPEIVQKAKTLDDGMTALDANDRPVMQDTGKTRFMGKEFEQAPDSATMQAMKNSAIVDVIKARDPIQAMQMEREFKADARSDYQFDRQKKADEKSDGYDKDRMEAFNGSRFATQKKDYGKELEQYQKTLDQYEKDKAAGKTVGTAPARPAEPEYTLGDRIADQARFLSVDAKYGKVDMDKFTRFADAVKKVKDEGYVKALQVAQAGGGLDQIAQAFNAAGGQKFDPASVVSDQTIKTKGGPDTRIIKYRDSAGNLQTINTVPDLKGMDAADKVFSEFFQSEQNRRGNNADVRAANAESRAAAKDQREQDEKTNTQNALEALYKERFPDATPAQTNAVRQGVIDPFKSKTDRGYDLNTDSTGRTGTRLNKDTGMVDVINLKDGTVIKTIPPTQMPENTTKATASVTSAQGTPPASNDAMLQQAQEAIAKGANPDEVWKRLIQMGYQMPKPAQADPAQQAVQIPQNAQSPSPAATPTDQPAEPSRSTMSPGQYIEAMRQKGLAQGMLKVQGEISDLEKEYRSGSLSEQEYLLRLRELSGKYKAIAQAR